VAFVLEPHNAFKRGVHHAIEIDRERVDDLCDAIRVARSFGDAAPLAELLQTWDPESTVTAENFFDADDGYPTHKWLDHRVIRGLQAEGTSDFGMGVHGALVDGNLVVGNRLVDEDAPVSPAWLETGLETDRQFHFASATHLLAHIDFHAGLDRDAISDVSEALDQGLTPDADLASHGEITLDMQQLEHELIKKLQAFRKALEDVARREGHVLSWFAEQTAL
jgi:hypothetical protein